MPPKRATQSPSATPDVGHKRDRDAGGEGAPRPPQRGRSEGGSQSDAPVATVVGREGSGSAPPAVASPLLTVGGELHNAAAAAGGQTPTAEHYEMLRRQLEDFFDVKKVLPRGPNSEEMEALRAIVRQLKGDLTEEQLQEAVGTAETCGCWKRAVVNSRSGNTVDVATALAKFAIFRLDVEQLPPADTGRAEVENHLVDFLLKSVLLDTLASRLKERLCEQSLASITLKFSIPFICAAVHVATFNTPYDVVKEEHMVNEFKGKYTEFTNAIRNMIVSTNAEAVSRQEPFPVVIGGESGSGKTFFSALAPTFILQAESAQGIPNEKLLTIYTRAVRQTDRGAPELSNVNQYDADLQKAKANNKPLGDYYDKRTDAAAAYLKLLVQDALDYRGELTLPNDERFERVFIIVDELFSQPRLFRSLLVAGSEQYRLLEFTKGFAKQAQLICCSTGSRSFLSNQGSLPEWYMSTIMQPSPLVFHGLTSGLKEAEEYLENPFFFAVVTNRRIGAIAAHKMRAERNPSWRQNNVTPPDDAALHNTGGAPPSESPSLPGSLSSGLSSTAGQIAFDAVKQYCELNGLRHFSGFAATAVTLEGLRRLIAHKPAERTSEGLLFQSMHDCSPVQLGTFSACTTVKNSNTELETRNVSFTVSLAQLVMTTIRYGALPHMFENSPNSFEQLNALVFAALFDAVRVLPPWEGSEKGRVRVLENMKKTEDNEGQRSFECALRGGDVAGQVSVAHLLSTLDPSWEYGEGAASDGEGLWGAMLKHTSVAPLLFSNKRIAPPSRGGKLDDAQFIDLYGKTSYSVNPSQQAFVVVNKELAPYADFLAVAHDVLFLVQCKLTVESFGSQAEVKTELAKMGFKHMNGGNEILPESDTEKWKYSSHFDYTAELLKKYNCKLAVPIFCVSGRASDRGRQVVATGHGWHGTVPFVNFNAGVEKTFVCEGAV